MPVKTEVQQAVLMSHHIRDFLVRQLIQLANAIRAHLGEFGLVVPQGVHSEEDQKTIRGIAFPTNGRLVTEAECDEFQADDGLTEMARAR